MREEQYNFIAFDTVAKELERKQTLPYIAPEKTNNNSPCKCGSGIKYKKCCKFKNVKG